MKKIVFITLFLCLPGETVKAGLWDIGKSVKKEKASREKAMLDAKSSLESTKILVGEAGKKMLAAKKTVEDAQEAVNNAQSSYEETKKFITTVDQEITKNSSLIAEQDKIIAATEKTIKEAHTFIEKEQQKREQATLAKQASEGRLAEAKKMQNEDRYQKLSETERVIETEKNRVATQKALYQEMVKAYEEKQVAYDHKKKLYNASIENCSKGLPCSTSLPSKV